MEKRINWIDWAKAIAVCSVVFCHLPQSQEWFYFRYMQATTITVFFFISGYLKKDHGSQQSNWRKYWQGLVLPYILYNALVYPYWFIRYYLQHGGLPDFFSAIKPIIGALLLEHENTWAEPLNGPLWYLPAILIMHLIIDGCRKTSHQHLMMIILCIVSYFLYAANKQYEFMPNLTPMGLFRRLPYYYLGYVMGQQRTFRSVRIWRDGMLCLACLILSLLFFEWHLNEQQILLHAALFYPVNIGLLFAVLCFCKLLDSCRLAFVTNLSIGTLVIIGLHIILIGIVNFAVDHFIGIREGLGYYWYEALPITAIIIALLYPIILWGISHAPVLIGKNKIIVYGTDCKE
jgi:fucose 4-O-acetylase-like acetyltransferase